MENIFEKAINSFRKRLSTLSQEEIEERLSKYDMSKYGNVTLEDLNKNNMNLTDKVKGILEVDIIEYSYKNPPNQYSKQIKELNKFTTKVAIDFAKWVVNSRYIAIRDSNEFTDYNANLYTTEQLFEEFLKDYKYD